MADKAKVIALLEQLQAEGAVIKDASEGRSGASLTSDALTATAADGGDWDAWVTWTKSF